MTKLISIIFLVIAVQGAFAQVPATTYTYTAPISLKAVIVKTYIRLAGFKKKLKTNVERNRIKKTPAPIPEKYVHEFAIDTREVNGRKVFVMRPRGRKAGKHILYIHGGGYLADIARQHWDLAAALIRHTSASVTMPDYPLTPAATVRDGMAMMERVYRDLLAQTSADSIILMGDSAGGGFVLALAEKLKEDGVAQPGQVILLSPWLDASMTNPEISSMERKDPWLDPDAMRISGKQWAGTLDTKTYLVSPIYGATDGLPQITVFIGGKDILLPDARKFKSIMAQRGTPINYYEYPKMFHVWMIITFLKEARHAISQVSALING